MNELHTLEVDRAWFFKLFHFVIQENYLYDCTIFFKQVRGITMGWSCSSILVDIYLHLYETNQTFKKNVSHYRYIDDVLHIKYNGFIDDVNLDFYPDTLKLKLSSNQTVNVEFSGS